MPPQVRSPFALGHAKREPSSKTATVTMEITTVGVNGMVVIAAELMRTCTSLVIAHVVSAWILRFYRKKARTVVMANVGRYTIPKMVTATTTTIIVVVTGTMVIVAESMEISSNTFSVTKVVSALIPLPPYPRRV